MKKYILLTLSAISFSLFAGELTPEIEAFTKVKLLGNYKVYLTKGDKASIKIINNDDNVMDESFQVVVKKGELSVKIKGDNFKERDVEVHLTYTDLAGIDVRRGAWVKLETPIKADSVSLEVASGGHIVGDIECRSIYAAISKGGSIKINGASPRAEYNVFAGGEMYAYGVVSDDIIAKVRTGGEISVTANGKFNALVFSGGTIRYKGTPDKNNFVSETKIAGDIKQIK